MQSDCKHKDSVTDTLSFHSHVLLSSASGLSLRLVSRTVPRQQATVLKLHAVFFMASEGEMSSAQTWNTLEYILPNSVYCTDIGK